ncbi:hypothetical protein [Bifidobacterium platyrrhinorum]|uniref:Late control protein n=1 Tax=Bifidobacterium platyrrhinorum TaxID=2661628 RepID=A0A6L9SSK9_9BIFI|nr:hypothetical protein [Bifidobacterium platyrrhinorum]NEG55474.1 hypothetical protein [Bifidobacterium platyrrhinorum]
MTDWTKPFKVSYRVMRVSRSTGNETSRLDWVVSGGSIERNQDTDICESGSLTVEGVTDLGTDRVRIWADCQWHDGSMTSVALGTFLPNIPTRSVNGEESSSQLDLYGLLQEAADDMFETPIKIGKGRKAVDAAADILKGCNLEVAAYDPGSYTMSEDWSFGLRSDKDKDKGSTKLDAVNDLLDLAGYSNARTDEMGRVVLQKYVEPSKRSPKWTFREGANATFLTTMTDERDLREVANVVKVTYYNTDKEYSSSAVDDDPNSEFSTVNRGRRVAHAYEYSSIPDEVKTDEQGRKLASDKALELLRTEQSVIHRVTFTHVYAPLNLTDVVDLEYPTGKVSGRFAIRTQRVTLDAGIPIECEARTFQRPGEPTTVSEPVAYKEVV